MPERPTFPGGDGGKQPRRPDDTSRRSRDHAGDPNDRRAAKDANRSTPGRDGAGKGDAGKGGAGNDGTNTRPGAGGVPGIAAGRGAAGTKNPAAGGAGGQGSQNGSKAAKGPGGKARDRFEAETGGKGKAGKALDKGLKAAKKADPTGTAQAADATMRVARVLKRRVLPAVAALLAFAITGSALGPVPSDDVTNGVEGAGTEIFEARFGESAAPLIKAWRTAAARTGRPEDGGVPWTVIASLAVAATEAGRFSPYDQCDRAKERGEAIVKLRPVAPAACDDPSAWPTASPAIGDPAKAQALGPYLLRPGSIPEGVDPQDLRARSGGPDDTPETATDFVAKRLWELRRDLTEEGWSFTDAELAQASWSEAVRRLGVASPNESQDCATPWLEPTDSQEVVLRAVDVTWRCELQRMPIHTLGSGSLSKTDTELAPDQAVDVVVSEAIGVAWAHLGATAQTACDPAAATPQGVFPLTQAVFDEFTPDPARDRCDRGASIHAAARAFAAVERLEAGVKHTDGIRDRSDAEGAYKPSIGGWATMPWVFGAEYAEVLANGPLSVETTSFKPTAACQAAVDAWSERIAAQLAGQPEGTFAYGQLTTAATAIIAGVIASDPRPDAQCPTTLRTQRSYAAWIASVLSARADVLYQAAGGTYPDVEPDQPVPTDSTPDATTTTTTTAPAVTTTTVPYATLAPSLALFALSRWAGTFIDGTPSVTPVSVVPGANTLISRLSPTGSTLDGVPTLPPLPSGSPYANKVALLARNIGGVIPGDLLASGTDPFSVLATPTFSTVAGTTCLPTPIAAAIDKAMTLWPQRVQPPFSTSRFGADLLVEQFSTESQSQWNRVAADGSTGVTIAAEGQLADTGPYDNDAYPRTPRGILGPRYGASDTDDGRIDGLVDADVAVGVTQFIPSTWVSYAALYDLDANGDGVEDPHNAFDAALATAIYYSRLASGKDLTVDQTAREAAVAQYGGFKPGSTKFAAYLTTRAEVSRKHLDCLSQYAAVTLSAPQTTIGPDGCVTSIPQGIMRDGSVALDVATLCAEGVAQAATPEAAMALKYVFANISATYTKSGRMKPGKYDCSSLVMRAYKEGAGLFRMYDDWAPPSHAMGPHSGWRLLPFLRDVPVQDLRPGDILVRVPPDGEHAMMVLIPGKWIIHTGGPEGAMGYIQKWPKDIATLKYRRVDPTGLK
jgi:hypothetical protein